MALKIVPQAVQTFLDLNGEPASGGFVYMYVVDQEVAKTTWQDPAGDDPNSNPIVLDERGQAIIWGEGAYRQRFLMANGDEVWDRPTETECCGADDDTSGSYYEVSFYWPSEITADAVVLLYPFAQDVNFADDFAGATPRIITPPGSEIELTITRIAADDTTDDIGTITIAADGTITFASTTTPEFESGGAMKITAPVDPDGATGLAITFLGFPVA